MEFYHEPQVDWTPTPKGFDGCKVAKAVSAINLNCVDKSNIGGLLGFHVLLYTSYYWQGSIALELDCANLKPQSYVQCWTITTMGSFWTGGAGTDHCNQASATVGTIPQAVVDFCNNGFT